MRGVEGGSTITQRQAARGRAQTDCGT